MTRIELKVARIGNSRGVRIPARTLERLGIGETVMMEERSDGILLSPTGPSTIKLSWEATARAMAADGEDWAEWDAASADGLDAIPWDSARPKRVAEPAPPSYRAKPARKKRHAK